MLLLADALNVNAALEQADPWVTGLDLVPIGGAVWIPDGALVDVGGDDVFPVGVSVVDGQVDQFGIELDESDVVSPTWTPLGRVTVASRLLFIGDPAAVERFTCDPFSGAFAAPSLWVVLRMATACVELQINAVDAEFDASAAAIRGLAV